MLIGQNGLNLIAEFEGFAPYLYNDPVGHATVGYGYLVHLGNYHVQRGICFKCDKWPRAIERHLWLTREQGAFLLSQTVASYARTVEVTTRRDIKQNPFDSLSSLCYNIGQGGYTGSQVRAVVNRYENPCPALRQIIRGTDGLIYPGLVRRREAECRLYHSNLMNSVPQEEPMLDMVVAEWWTKGQINGVSHNGWFGPGSGEMNLFKDFGPGKAYEVIVILAPDSRGDWNFKNGDFTPAGSIIEGERSKQIILIPGHYGTVPFDIRGRIHIQYLALTGVIK